jgi:hypothetical protein
VIWASYAFFIGRLGGKAFEDRPWAGLLLALGLTVVISVLIEAVRRAWVWRRRRQDRARAADQAGAQEHSQAREPSPPAGARGRVAGTAALGLAEQGDGR